MFIELCELRRVENKIKWQEINKQQQFVNCDKQFVNCTYKGGLPLANREINLKNQLIKSMLDRVELRRGLSITLIVGVFIGFLKPFGMDELSLGWSVAYWLFTCTCGYFVYMPFTYFGNVLLAKIVPIHWCRIAISAFLASAAMSFVVPLIIWLFFSIEINFAEQFFVVFPKALVIGSVVTVISIFQDYFTQQNTELNEQKKINKAHQEHVKKTTTEDIEKFMIMLPLDKRGDLLCLEMADHYVKVYTSQGHHLLLMRFKDALELLIEYPGLQTHRSWWVAKSAIKSTKKIDRKVILSLVNGVEVPVSRTYMNDLKLAGLH